MNLENRPLRKLGFARKIGGDSERRTGVYTRVHEDSNTESTNKLPTKIEFPKRSNVTQYFPSGVALRKYFMNREKERDQLKKNILANRHMILMAPHRYGKTS